jgi:Acyltransferase family
VQTVLERSRTLDRHERRARRVDTRAGRARIPYLDNLKLLLVAVIIAGHGALAYGDLESAWPYQDIQEVQLAGVSNAALSAAVIPAVLFAMGLFFLISGLVTFGSLARKGPRTFARNRLVRLGLPLVGWTLLVWPGAIWLSHLAAGDSESFWAELGDDEPILDTGPMWFVAVLLVYSLAYAAWRSWRQRGAAEGDLPRRSDRGAPLSGRTLLALAAAISLATAVVRLVFPIASPQTGQSHLWQWPQFVTMFGLGIVAAQRGWLAPVPDRLRRGCGFAALGGVVAWGVIAATVAATGTDFDVTFDTGLHWASLAMALIEGPLAVGASIWLLGLAQRCLNRRPGALGRALARSAYGAFLLQGVVLIGLMVALRPVGLPAEIKALTAAGAGVAGSFALAWLLVTRTRLGQIL